MRETVPARKLVTTANWESDEMASVRGSSPTGISANTASVVASTRVIESLSGLTAATNLPLGATATADEETAPVWSRAALEVGGGVGVNNGAAVCVGVRTGLGSGGGLGVAVGFGKRAGSDVGVGVDRPLGVGASESAIGVDTIGRCEFDVGAVPVGVDVADGPVHAASASPRVANTGIAARPGGIRIISSSCRHPHRPE